MEVKNKRVIDVNDLVKEYGSTRAVNGISFTVEQGEIFGMLGPNGAGKTTTIECVEGLRKPDEGKVSVLGMDPRQDGYEVRQRIGIQFQTAALPNRIKVGEALELFATFYQKKADCQALMNRLGLNDWQNELVTKLSGGQKQRVYIALALVNDPEIVFLDELTTGLDPQSRRSIWDLVEEIRAHGKTVYLTTHFMEEAERLCDRVAIVDQGKIIALDSPQALIDALGDESRVVFETKKPLVHGLVDNLPGVRRVEKIGDRIVVYGRKEGMVSQVANALDRAHFPFSNIRSEQPTLEDVFLKLTGNQIRI